MKLDLGDPVHLGGTPYNNLADLLGDSIWDSANGAFSADVRSLLYDGLLLSLRFSLANSGKNILSAHIRRPFL